MDAALKDLARRTAFAARKAAFSAPNAADIMARANANLVTVLAGFEGAILAGYMPMRTEIDPLAAMHAHIGPLCVPVIDAPAAPLRFAAYHLGAQMQMGAFGARIPLLLNFIVPRVLIVPLLAFDGQGYRLGYGGGFYDRTLEGLRAPTYAAPTYAPPPDAPPTGAAPTGAAMAKGARPIIAIGFAFAAQEVDAVPRDATDQALDMIVTEEGVRRF